MFKKQTICFGVFLMSALALASENVKPFRLAFEAGSLWQSRNDVRIPGDGGTLISLDEFSNGPFFNYRIYATYRFNHHHSIRALYAPLSVSVQGTPLQAISFNSQTFASGDLLDARYQFNSYRLAYIYSFSKWGKWQLDLGFSAKIRDADVSLKNASTQSSYSNIGFVPLLLTTLQYDIAPGWTWVLDVEALGAPQGRALDASTRLHYSFPLGLDVGLGYRTVEGGADNDKVFTFAWLHYAIMQVGYRF